MAAAGEWLPGRQVEHLVPEVQNSVGIGLPFISGTRGRENRWRLGLKKQFICCKGHGNSSCLIVCDS